MNAVYQFDGFNLLLDVTRIGSRYDWVVVKVWGRCGGSEREVARGTRTTLLGAVAKGQEAVVEAVRSHGQEGE